MTETLAVALIPVIETVTGWLTAMLDAFHSLTPGQQEMIAQIVAVVAAAGPLLFIGGKLVASFASIAKGFSALSRLLMANPWLLLIAATVALVVLIVKNWDTIKATVLAAWDAIKSWTSGAWETIKGWFSSALSTIAGWVQNWGLIKLFVATWGAIRNGVAGVKAFIEDKWNAIVGFFEKIPGWITDGLSGLWEAIVGPFRGPIAFVEGRIDGLRSAWDNLMSAVSGSGKLLVPVVPKAGNYDFPEFQTGGVFHAPGGQSQGFALLHDRERVVTETQWRAMMRTITAAELAAPATHGRGGPAIGQVNNYTEADPMVVAAGLHWMLRTSGVG
ncbi:MAG: hypothetical protein H0V96_12605 [Acidimicrobiia bacterium]|nr:hypothetical protein [Acidimicrobiia bacterium]